MLAELTKEDADEFAKYQSENPMEQPAMAKTVSELTFKEKRQIRLERFKTGRSDNMDTQQLMVQMEEDRIKR